MAPDPVNPEGFQDDVAASSDESAKPGTPASDLPPERMRQILDRIASDHYDRTDVLDHLARAVARELERRAGADRD